jgi:hypothetical protein
MIGHAHHRGTRHPRRDLTLQIEFEAALRASFHQTSGSVPVDSGVFPGIRRDQIDVVKTVVSVRRSAG